MNQTQDARPRPAIPLRLGLVLTFVLALVAVMLAPPPARALSGTGHGFGYLSKADNRSWLGSYRMDDGTLAFCIESGRPAPTGHPYSSEYTDRAKGASQDDTAKLAYIARRWGQTTDNDEAAAGQLAVWTIMGLNGHTQEYYAARANDRADVVLARARFMLTEAAREANRTQDVRLDFDVDASGRPGVTAQVRVHHLDGHDSIAPAGEMTGTLMVRGATLGDGATQAKVANGRRTPLSPTAVGGHYDVTAQATFKDIPYGGWVYVGGSVDASQAVLLAYRPTGVAAGSGEFSGPSPLPFQPTVSTKTSDALAKPGAVVHDDLELGLAAGDGLSGSWGEYRSGTTWAPVPVTIRSRLLGPFRETPALAAEWPADAPEVCAVSTIVTSGPGDYRSPECRLPRAGHYVWVETIDPADTPVDRGRDRLRGWTSRFGEAAESTLVPAEPTIATTADSDTATSGDCVSDHLVVDGLPDDTPLEVETILVGPLPSAVVDGTDLTEGFDDLPRAGAVTTRVEHDGQYETRCVRVEKPGQYAFVYRSDGSAVDSGGQQLVKPFADLVAHRSEMVRVAVPPTPPVPPVPPAPSVTPSTPPRALAYTGSDGTTDRVLVGVGAGLVGAAALVSSLVARRVRRKRLQQGRSEG